MSWVVIVWSMMAASSLTLAVIHLFVWFRQLGDYSHLLFALLAVSAGVFGGFELVLMQSATPEAYATTLRWAHVPLTAFVLSTVGFVYFYFGAGNALLALATCATRLLALVLNFTTGVNINFREVTGLDRLAVWGGEWVAAPIGVTNPWTIVPQVSNAMLIALIIVAAVTVWRRGDPAGRRRALVVGGSLALCIGFAAGIAALTITGVVHAPTIIMPTVFIVVVAMGYDLVGDVIAAARLSTQLRASEARFRAVVQSVPTAILLVDQAGSITFANAQARAVFGYAPEELAGKHVEDLVPSKMLPYLEGTIHVAREGFNDSAPLPRFTGTVEFPMADGRYRRPAMPYGLWMLQRALDAMHAMSPANFTAARAWFARYGADRLLDIAMPRLRRAGLCVALVPH